MRSAGCDGAAIRPLARKTFAGRVRQIVSSHRLREVQGVMTVFPSALPFSAATSSSSMRVIGGHDDGAADERCRQAARTRLARQFSMRKLTPANSGATRALRHRRRYRVVRAVPPGRTNFASVAKPSTSLATSRARPMPVGMRLLHRVGPPRLSWKSDRSPPHCSYGMRCGQRRRREPRR